MKGVLSEQLHSGRGVMYNPYLEQKAVAFCKKEMWNLKCGDFFTLGIGSIFVYLLSFMHCLAIMKRTADMCLWTCRQVCARQGGSAQHPLDKGQSLKPGRDGQDFIH